MRGNPDTTNIWIADAARGVFSRVTEDPGGGSDPTWSPDEQHLAFGRQCRVFVKDLVTGTQRAIAGANEMYVDDWTPDGRLLICRNEPGGVLALPASGTGSITRLLMEASSDETEVSNDGHWVAYNGDESGQWEVYVASFPGFSGKQQVSVAGGVQPHWRRDGRELFFMTPAGQVMSAAVRPTPKLQIDTPKPLFTTNLVPGSGWSEYSVTPDGQRFLVMEPSRQFFTLLQHWLPATSGSR